MSGQGEGPVADAFAAKLSRLGVVRGATAKPVPSPAPPSRSTSPSLLTSPPTPGSPADGPTWLASMPPALRERLRRTMAAAPVVAPSEFPLKPLPGGLSMRKNGAVHVAEWSVPRASLHGTAFLNAAHAERAKTAAAAARDPRFLSIDPDRWGYFDTETTSLNSGAGVWVFMVGVARFVGDEFRIRQFLLTGPAGEPAFLDAVREEFAAVDALVSFHGKSFDAPRIDDRCRLAAFEDICSGRPHWDLLHATRRLYAPRWPDCRLRTAEERLLGFHRTDDLPGAECPAQFFAFVRGGRHRMADVLEHNRLDTASLAALAGRLASDYTDPGDDPFLALMAGYDWSLTAESDLARGLLLRGVSAWGQCSASMREKIRRSLRRLGEKPLADSLRTLGAALADTSVRSQTTSVR